MPIISIFFLVLACFAFPASALYTYEDYISNMEVDGENEIITVTLPIDRTRLQVWNSDWSVIARENGSSISFSVAELATYHFGIYPMYGDALSVSDLPNGSSLTFSYSISDSAPGYQTPSSFGEFTYYNAAGVELRNDRVNGPTQAISDTYSFTFTLNKPDTADNCAFSLHIGNFMPYYSGRVTLVVKEVKMGISISALYRQQQLTGKTNKLLDEVNRQLEEQGKTMNDILNGTPEQNESANNAAGVLGDKGEQLGNLAGDIQPNKPNLDSVSTNVSDIVPSTGVSFLTSAISPFANNELVIKLLVIVATLILVSYVLFGKRG